MVSTRLTRRSEAEIGFRARRSKAASARAEASSSSAKAPRTLQSDENAPLGRRVLGDVKNVVAESKAVNESRSPRRKPLSDRNASIPVTTSLVSDKAKQARGSRKDASKIRTDDDNFESMFMMPTKSRSGRNLAEPKTAPAPKAAASGSRRARQPSSKTDKEGALASQIEAASRLASKAGPSHDKLTRLSADLDSDDLEYFEVSALEQPTQIAKVATKTAKRDQAPRSEDKDSDENLSPSQGSFGSSDKENVPPPTALSRTAAHNRTAAYTRTGVLGSIERSQPTHSTPLTSKAQAVKGQKLRPRYLDDVFLQAYSSSSQADSPGVARRAEVLPASSKLLLEYQEQGVSKVMAWKAAGHDEARKARGNSSDSGIDAGSVASWPSRGDPGIAADGHERDFDGDDMDEFGFLTAEHKVRARRARERVESLQSSKPAGGDDSDALEDLPSEPPPVNTASDDHRLAEQAFGLMSSPAVQRRTASSPTLEPGSVMLIGDHELDDVQRSEPSVDGDDQEEVRVEDEVSKRVTRGSMKRKSDAAAAAVAEAADEEISAPSSLSLELSPRKSSQKANKARKSVAGIPLRKTEKKEQAVLEMLAAQPSSSPANSDASYSPRVERSAKRSAGSPATKKYHMDEILDLLPLRKRNTSSFKAKASQSKKKTTSTSRKGRATSVARASNSRSTGNKGKGRAVQGDDDDDDESVDGNATRSKPKRPAAPKAKRGKARAEPDSTEDEAVSSSQIHSDDSSRTRRLKEFRAIQKYHLEVEEVL
ncbi:hypothetical protein EX895_002389 [Sporisorium graminicola]|uniref:Uncharacterized protein n=1 Tax=Sporisorium graminicola TaxID=280036 RepID=A0A4U7KZ82_9BASI|nr:hypothetical protein EX895_002389 [Sporisorium graminicola]TKY88758.1 hypothetical protein EX895_002389 [Sporisorium graminicola]